MQNKQGWISQNVQIINFLKVYQKKRFRALLTCIYELLYLIELCEFTANVKLCQYLADSHMQVYKERGSEELSQKCKICLF